MGIKIDYKQFIRDREWFGFVYIVCELSDVREWAWGLRIRFRGQPLGHTTVPKRWKFWVIKRLNAWA